MLHHCLPWVFSSLGSTDQVQPPCLIEEETEPLRREALILGDKASHWPKWVCSLKLSSGTPHCFRIPCFSGTMELEAALVQEGSWLAGVVGGGQGRWRGSPGGAQLMVEVWSGCCWYPHHGSCPYPEALQFPCWRAVCFHWQVLCSQQLHFIYFLREETSPFQGKFFAHLYTWGYY